MRRIVDRLISKRIPSAAPIAALPHIAADSAAAWRLDSHHHAAMPDRPESKTAKPALSADPTQSHTYTGTMQLSGGFSDSVSGATAKFWCCPNSDTLPCKLGHSARWLRVLQICCGAQNLLGPTAQNHTLYVDNDMMQIHDKTMCGSAPPIHKKGGHMANVYDVASYILEKCGQMTAMKLQKLVYYSQAWSLVWDKKQLFPERIEAWANGPVSPALYARHSGKFVVRQILGGNSRALTSSERDTVDAVLKYYGDKDPQWLSDLTHAEKPWRRARAGVPDGENSSNVISIASMAEYYGGL